MGGRGTSPKGKVLFTWLLYRDGGCIRGESGWTFSHPDWRKWSSRGDSGPLQMPSRSCLGCQRSSHGREEAQHVPCAPQTIEQIILSWVAQSHSTMTVTQEAENPNRFTPLQCAAPRTTTTDLNASSSQTYSKCSPTHHPASCWMS